MNVASPACCFDFSIDVPDWLKAALGDSDPHGLLSNLSPDEVDLVRRAFRFGYELHEGQCRASGEPYIAHPVAVAGLLRDLGGNGATIAAGFLHDVVEDTDITPEELEIHFGEEVRRLVEGVTKLSKFNFSSKTERQAENFRRMFLAMAQDIRVIVVKLADRLHNMRTLTHLAPAKQKRIAQETLEIFAPLANRLGIGRLKWELEDLSFKYLDGEAYARIRDLVADKRGDRETRIQAVASTLSERLQAVGITDFEVSGRPKHLYGIYTKMQRQQKDFTEIYDIAAVRVIVNSNDECYRALAIVHDAFNPIPGRFKDYIGLPKPNRYQSLHTGVIGKSGRPIEVQIRTAAMHHVAEYGIAAHWKYKESGSVQSQWTAEDEKFTWLRQLLDWQHDLKDAQEYLDSIKDNLFEDDVYVFTPDGDVVALKQGATPVDFAYRIHTEVGNHCAGAKVDGRIVPLDSRLHNGSIVEIITQKNSHPSLDWLNFVMTPSARNRIRQWYKRSHRDENVARGREMLEKELGKSGFEALLKSEPMKTVAERCNYHSVEDLLAAVGYGEVTLNQVLNRLQDTVKVQQTPPEVTSFEQTTVSLLNKAIPDQSKSNGKFPIAGIEGMVYHLAGCCKPVPGEGIIGVVTRGDRGISIHNQHCGNVSSVPGERLVPVSWNNQEDTSRPPTYPVDISIEVLDRVGVLNDILSRLKDNNINVHSAQVRTTEGKPAIIDLGIGIRDLGQLDRTFAQIRQMSDVLNMRRLQEGRVS